MTSNPPAPASIIELISCGYENGCKNNFVCTEMCRYKDCKNVKNMENDKFESEDRQR